MEDATRPSLTLQWSWSLEQQACPAQVHRAAHGAHQVDFPRLKREAAGVTGGGASAAVPAHAPVMKDQPEAREELVSVASGCSVASPSGLSRSQDVAHLPRPSQAAHSETATGGCAGGSQFREGTVGPGARS